jgi:hypothetical protein
LFIKSNDGFKRIITDFSIDSIKDGAVFHRNGAVTEEIMADSDKINAVFGKLMPDLNGLDFEYCEFKAKSKVVKNDVHRVGIDTDEFNAVFHRVNAVTDEVNADSHEFNYNSDEDGVEFQIVLSNAD